MSIRLLSSWLCPHGEHFGCALHSFVHGGQLEGTAVAAGTSAWEFDRRLAQIPMDAFRAKGLGLIPCPNTKNNTISILSVGLLGHQATCQSLQMMSDILGP